MPLYSKFYYHDTTRRYVIAFGSLFNNINVVRYKDGVEVEREKVPITYSPKERFFMRTEQDPEDRRSIAFKYPKIGFEVPGFTYAPSRHTFKQRKISFTDPTNANKRSYQYNAVPYDLSFMLYLAANSQDEIRQMMEQIIPFFSPSYTITVKVIPALNVLLDVPVVLNSVGAEDDYDQEFDNVRHIRMTLEFTVKGFYFGPTRSSNVIKHSHVNIRPLGTTPEEDGKYAEILVEPFNPDIPLDELTKEDDYGYTTTITEYVNPI